MAINLDHSTVETLQQRAADKNNKAVKELVVLLFETKLFRPGFSLEHTHTHSNSRHSMMEQGLGIDEDQVTVEKPVLLFLISPSLQGDEDTCPMEEVGELFHWESCAIL